jgi:hypothetical protein
MTCRPRLFTLIASGTSASAIINLANVPVETLAVVIAAPFQMTRLILPASLRVLRSFVSALVASAAELGPRTPRLAEEKLVVFGYHEGAEHADLFIPESFIQLPCSGIEGRHTHEDVRAVTEDSVFGPSNQRRSESTFNGSISMQQARV